MLQRELFNALHEDARSLLLILAYLLLCAAIAVALHGLGLSDRLRVLTFAAATLALSLLLPRFAKPLEGRFVDLLYYTTAIAAACVIFISQEARQQLIRLEREHADREVEISRLEEALGKLERDIAGAESNLTEVREQIFAREAFLKSPAVRSLKAHEARVTTELLGKSVLYVIEDDLRLRAESCTQEIRDAVSEIARIDTARSLQQLDEFRPRPGLVDVDSIQRQLQVDVIERCEGIQALHRALAAAAPDFEKIRALWGFYTSRDFQPRTRRRPPADARIALGDGERQAGDLLDLVLEVQRSEILLSADTAKEGALTETLQRWRGQRETTQSTMQETKAAKDATLSDIEAAKEQTLRGWALTASEWLAFTWPYFLIALLGAKIARVDYIARAKGMLR